VNFSATEYSGTGGHSLAAERMRFTQFYSGSPVCAPSPGAFLTGRHTGHAYVRDNQEFRGFLDSEERGHVPRTLRRLRAGCRLAVIRQRLLESRGSADLRSSAAIR
jgi:hypothetical protein